MDTTTLTGIPVDVLFAVVGALIVAIAVLVYAKLNALERGQRKLSDKGEARDKKLTRLSTLMLIVCTQLKIPAILTNGDDGADE